MPCHCRQCSAVVGVGRRYCSDVCLILHRIVIDGDCWIWTGAVKSAPPDNYGRITTKRDGKARTLLAHRVSYEAFVGPIPDGLMLLHSCDNPPCVNPEHLRPGTNLENLQEAVQRGKTICGLTTIGTRNHKAKLTEDDVSRIRDDATSSNVALAAKHKVSPTTISDVRRGKIWRTVK